MPLLLDEKSSVFQPQDLQGGKNPFSSRPSGSAKLRAGRALPTIGKNIRAKENYTQFAELLPDVSPNPYVLVIGGATVGAGLEAILSTSAIHFVESDVYLSDRTALICDAHNIPFEDETFDGVIMQAVLEHVADPNRCVKEAHRVLKVAGIVYADTPFMQQVHAGGHDFTRFTHVGQRRLFRKFEEVSSGASCGPAMALAWAYQYFLLSFVRSKTARRVAIAFARVTGFWLKYLDHYLIRRPGAIDAASALYFLGRKSKRSLSDAEAFTATYSSVELPEEFLAAQPRDLCVGKRSFHLVSVGSLDHLYKAPDVLIDAVGECVSRGWDLELTLVGGGCQRAALESRASRLGPTNRVCFLGQLSSRDAVRSALDRADLFVLPSRQEGLPRAMIEAMARGLPCIGSRVGGIPEVLDRTDLVATDDVGGLAGKISEVLSDPERLRSMSVRNWRRAGDYREEALRPKRDRFYRYLRTRTEQWLQADSQQPAKALTGAGRSTSRTRFPK